MTLATSDDSRLASPAGLADKDRRMTWWAILRDTRGWWWLWPFAILLLLAGLAWSLDLFHVWADR